MHSVLNFFFKLFGKTCSKISIKGHTRKISRELNEDVFNDVYDVFFLFFFIKAYVVGTHLNCLDNICFYKALNKSTQCVI